MRAVENSSTAVAAETAIRLIRKNTGDKLDTINNAIMKKAADPSNDLLNNFVLPNFSPIIAATESAKLNTNNPIIVAFSLNINVVSAAPITTHEAPDRLRYSIGRVKTVKK